MDLTEAENIKKRWQEYTKELCKIIIIAQITTICSITLLTKVHLIQAMVFPVVMYECERWTIKKPEH